MKQPKQDIDDKKAQEFISKGSSLPEKDNDMDHRLTLRMPKWLLAKIDKKKENRGLVLLAETFGFLSR